MSFSTDKTFSDSMPSTWTLWLQMDFRLTHSFWSQECCWCSSETSIHGKAFAMALSWYMSRPMITKSFSAKSPELTDLSWFPELWCFPRLASTHSNGQGGSSLWSQLLPWRWTNRKVNDLNQTFASFSNNSFQVRHWKKLGFGSAPNRSLTGNSMLHAPELGNQEASSLPWRRRMMEILKRQQTLFSKKFCWTTNAAGWLCRYLQFISLNLIKSLRQ